MELCCFIEIAKVNTFSFKNNRKVVRVVTRYFFGIILSARSLSRPASPIVVSSSSDGHLEEVTIHVHRRLAGGINVVLDGRKGADGARCGLESTTSHAEIVSEFSLCHTSESNISVEWLWDFRLVDSELSCSV